MTSVPRRVLSVVLGLSFSCFAALSTHAAGVVAETSGGKRIVFEYYTIGTGPTFTGADLRIIDGDGNAIFEETFDKTSLIQFHEKFVEGGGMDIRIHLRTTGATFDLRFEGTNRKLAPRDGQSEIEALLELLGDPGRKPESGSLLILKTPIGNFTFEDVLCAIYGDV